MQSYKMANDLGREEELWETEKQKCLASVHLIDLIAKKEEQLKQSSYRSFRI